MKQATYTASPHPPDRPLPESAQEPEESAPTGSIFIKWLKHLAMYMGTVLVACAIGSYFLWQLTKVHDLPQIIKNVSDNAPPPRPLTTAVGPPILSSKSQQSSIAQPPGPASAVTATASSPVTPPATDGNPMTPPSNTDPQAAASLEPQPEPTPSEDTATAPAEDAAPPTPETEIEQLLATAQQQMDSRRFTAPASGNALQTYQRILELQPDHPTAADGIQRIAAYYVDVAEQSLRQGRVDESLAYISRGLRATPKNPALLNLRKTAQQAKRREQERQQALQEETQRQQQQQQQHQEQWPWPQERSSQQPIERQQQPWWRQPNQPHNDSGFNQR